MKISLIALLASSALCVALGASQGTPPASPPPALPAGHPATGQQPPLPAGHPATGQQQPQLPQGHPATPGNEPPMELSPDWPIGKPEDVKSVDAIIAAYYATVSGAKGEARDWNRLRSLMLPEAKMFSSRIAGDRPIPIVLTIDQYIDTNRKYFERGGYFEKEVHHKVDTFGNIAQVFSTYESRRAAEAPEPYSRGLNSFQLINDGERWWIVSVLWTSETPDHPIPVELLGTPPALAAPAPEKK
jgi:hypothetical protein